MTIAVASSLAGLSTVGFVINLPFVNSELDFLERWLEPVLRGAPELSTSVVRGRVRCCRPSRSP